MTTDGSVFIALAGFFVGIIVNVVVVSFWFGSLKAKIDAMKDTLDDMRSASKDLTARLGKIELEHAVNHGIRKL